MAVSVPAYLMDASIVEERALPSPQWGIYDEGRSSPAPPPDTGPRRFAAPACTVLDGKGVIRFEQVRAKSLDEAVDTLLKGLRPSFGGRRFPGDPARTDPEGRSAPIARWA